MYAIPLHRNLIWFILKIDMPDSNTNGLYSQNDLHVGNGLLPFTRIGQHGSGISKPNQKVGQLSKPFGPTIVSKSTFESFQVRPPHPPLNAMAIMRIDSQSLIT